MKKNTVIKGERAVFYTRVGKMFFKKITDVQRSLHSKYNSRTRWGILRMGWSEIFSSKRTPVFMGKISSF